jgi:hypothetical protein
VSYPASHQLLIRKPFYKVLSLARGIESQALLSRELVHTHVGVSGIGIIADVGDGITDIVEVKTCDSGYLSEQFVIQADEEGSDLGICGIEENVSSEAVALGLMTYFTALVYKDPVGMLDSKSGVLLISDVKVLHPGVNLDPSLLSLCDKGGEVIGIIAVDVFVKALVVRNLIRLKDGHTVIEGLKEYGVDLSVLKAVKHGTKLVKISLGLEGVRSVPDSSEG